MEFTDIQKVEFETLCRNYEYTSILNDRKSLFLFSYFVSEYDHKDIVIGNNLKIASFIKFLRSCYGSEIQLTSTISNAGKGEVKGSVKKFILDDELLLDHIQLLAHTLLESNQDGLYQYEFDWEFKDNHY